MYRFVTAALVVASSASNAEAQTAGQSAAIAQQTLTLSHALELSGTSSPSLEANAATVRAASSALSVAALRPNPELVAETENVVGTGPYRGFRSAETTIGVAVPLELGGKRSARVAVAGAQLTRAQVGAAVARADLILLVTQQYTEAVAAEQRLGIARGQLQLAEEASRVAHVRIVAGVASPIELQRAEVLRINAQTALDNAVRSAALARENLGRLSGRSLPNERLDSGWFETIATQPLPGGTDPEGTLSVAAATADATVATAQLRLARAQRVPDVTVSASARRFSESSDTAAVFGVSVPIPLFNNGSAAVAQARALQDAATAQRRLAVSEAERSIAAARIEVANAADTARGAGGPALAAATEAARIVRVGYAAGRFSQLELLDAERTLAQTRGEWVNALAAYHDAKARLERLLTSAPAPGDS